MFNKRVHYLVKRILMFLGQIKQLMYLEGA